LPSPKVEPKSKLVEFRVRRQHDRCRRRAEGFDTSSSGQLVDVTGTSIGKGFAGGMKRWNFGGLRATHGVSVSHRSHRFDRFRPGSGPTFKGKKMAGHMGRRASPPRTSKSSQTDEERGLILVEGAVPGSKGAWIHVVREAPLRRTLLPKFKGARAHGNRSTARRVMKLEGHS
jgi:large subunit ribosomal protein L3